MYECQICDEEHDVYMVHDEVFYPIVPEGKGHMCIECLEGQLGRRLDPTDFTSAPCNFITKNPLIVSRASYFDDCIEVDFSWYQIRSHFDCLYGE